MNSNLKLKSIISLRTDLDSFARCCNFPSKSKAHRFGMSMYKNIMTFFKYSSFFFDSIQQLLARCFFFVRATDFCSHFFSVQQASSNKFWFGEHFSEKNWYKVYRKCNPYVLEIWFVISDLWFYFSFDICGKVTALIITNNWKYMSNYERFSDRYFIWDFITW